MPEQPQLAHDSAPACLSVPDARQANKTMSSSPPEYGAGGGSVDFPPRSHAAIASAFTSPIDHQSPEVVLRVAEQFIVEGLTPPTLRSAMQRIPLPRLTPEAVLAEWGDGGLLGASHGTAWSPRSPAQDLLAGAR